MPGVECGNSNKKKITVLPPFSPLACGSDRLRASELASNFCFDNPSGHLPSAFPGSLNFHITASVTPQVATGKKGVGDTALRVGRERKQTGVCVCSVPLNPSSLAHPGTSALGCGVF